MKKKMDYRARGILTAFALSICIWGLFFGCVSRLSAQSVKRQGNTFIEQADTAQTKTLKGKVYETDYIYVDKEGHAYNVFLSSNGNAFINKISKKSGRKYRKYLPEVTKMIQNQGK